MRKKLHERSRKSRGNLQAARGREARDGRAAQTLYPPSQIGKHPRVARCDWLNGGRDTATQGPRTVWGAQGPRTGGSRLCRCDRARGRAGKRGRGRVSRVDCVRVREEGKRRKTHGGWTGRYLGYVRREGCAARRARAEWVRAREAYLLYERGNVSTESGDGRAASASASEPAMAKDWVTQMMVHDDRGRRDAHERWSTTVRPVHGRRADSEIGVRTAAPGEEGAKRAAHGESTGNGGARTKGSVRRGLRREREPDFDGNTESESESESESTGGRRACCVMADARWTWTWTWACRWTLTLDRARLARERARADKSRTRRQYVSTSVCDCVWTGLGREEREREGEREVGADAVL